MNKFHFLSSFCLVLGIVFLFIGFLSGDIEAGIILILPFISGSGIFGFLGFIFILVSFFLFLFGLTSLFQDDFYKTEDSEFKTNKKPSVKGGGVVLIGPIPIIFGSSWKIAIISVILAIILIIASYFFYRS